MVFFPSYDVFVSVNGFDIKWYGVTMMLGFVAAFILCNWFCKKRKFPDGMSTDLLLCAIIGGVIGARSYYVIFRWENYYVAGNFGATLRRIFDIRSGGLAIYGGVIGAVAAILIFSCIKKYKFISILDLCAAPLALGQAIGRWGNFFNQEAHGALVENPSLQFFPYAVYLNDPHGHVPEAPGWYQATFFYESVWCLLLAGLLVWLFFKQKYRGQAVLVYLAVYGAERAVVESFRTDSLMLASFRVSALLSAILCATAVVLLIVFAVQKRNNTVIYENKKGEDKDETEVREI